jgi:hypothetical protein
MTASELPCLLDVNDLELRLWRGDTLVAHEPGFATWTGQRLELGVAGRASAWRYPRQTHHRYWQTLDTSPIQTLGKRVRHAGDLVYLQLEALRRRAGNPRAVTVLHPGHWQRAQLGLLLGIADAAGLGVSGLVEHGVAVGATLPPGTWTLVTACLEQTIISVLEVDDTQAVRTQLRVLSDGGFLALEASLVAHVVEVFLRERRFDPLHDGATEQRLHDQLPGWLDLLSTREEIDVVLSHGGQHHAVVLRRDAVAAALLDARSRLRAACGSGPVLVDDRLAQLPGLLEDWPEAMALPLGTAERGLLASPDLPRLADSGLISRTNLAVTPGPRLWPSRATQPFATDAAPCTHLLLGNRAHALGTGSWTIDATGHLRRASQGITPGTPIGRLSRTSTGEVRVSAAQDSPLRLNGTHVAGDSAVIPGDRLEILGTDRVYLAITVTAEDAA